MFRLRNTSTVVAPLVLVELSSELVTSYVRGPDWPGVHELTVENSTEAPAARTLNRTREPAALVHVAATAPPDAETAPSPRIDFGPPSSEGDGEGDGDGRGEASGEGEGRGEGSGEGDGDATGAGPLEGDGEGDGDASGDGLGDGDGDASGDGDGDGDGDDCGRDSGDGDGDVSGALARRGDGDGEIGGRTDSGMGAFVPAVWSVPGLFAAPAGCALRREGVILVTMTHHDSAGRDTMSVTRYFHTPASA